MNAEQRDRLDLVAAVLMEIRSRATLEDETWALTGVAIDELRVLLDEHWTWPGRVQEFHRLAARLAAQSDADAVKSDADPDAGGS